MMAKNNSVKPPVTRICNGRVEINDEGDTRKCGKLHHPYHIGSDRLRYNVVYSSCSCGYIHSFRNHV